MTALSGRDKNLAIIVGVLLLYVFAALSYRKQTENWKIARKLYRTAQNKLEAENKLISERRAWDDRYEEMQSLMPVFPESQDVDTHWLNIMDSVAEKNHLAIARRQANKEVEVGDVFELPIDCKDWEGSLNALVHFLWELNQKGAMLDVRQMFIRPSQRPGFLRGTFTLYCAYMRGEGAAPVIEPPPAVAEKTDGDADSPKTEKQDGDDDSPEAEKPDGEKVPGTTDVDSGRESPPPKAATNQTVKPLH